MRLCTCVSFNPWMYLQYVSLCMFAFPCPCIRMHSHRRTRPGLFKRESTSLSVMWEPAGTVEAWELTHKAWVNTHTHGNKDINTVILNGPVRQIKARHTNYCKVTVENKWFIPRHQPAEKLFDLLLEKHKAGFFSLTCKIFNPAAFLGLLLLLYYAWNLVYCLCTTFPLLSYVLSVLEFTMN